MKRIIFCFIMGLALFFCAGVNAQSAYLGKNQKIALKHVSKCPETTYFFKSAENVKFAGKVYFYADEQNANIHHLIVEARNGEFFELTRNLTNETVTASCHKVKPNRKPFIMKGYRDVIYVKKRRRVEICWPVKSGQEVWHCISLVKDQAEMNKEKTQSFY